MSPSNVGLMKKGTPRRTPLSCESRRTATNHAMASFRCRDLRTQCRRSQAASWPMFPVRDSRNFPKKHILLGGVLGYIEPAGWFRWCRRWLRPAQEAHSRRSATSYIEDVVDPEIAAADVVGATVINRFPGCRLRGCVGLFIGRPARYGNQRDDLVYFVVFPPSIIEPRNDVEGSSAPPR